MLLQPHVLNRRRSDSHTLTTVLRTIPALLAFGLRMLLPRIHLLGTHHRVVQYRCTIGVPLAVIRENNPLVKVESYATVLTRMVVDVVIPVVEHQAKPLHERIQLQMQPIRAIAFVAALVELLVQVGIIRLIGLNIVNCCPVYFSIGSHLS